jgi:transposase
MSERHSMRKVREVLRLKHELKLSDRKIERSVGLGHGTAGEYLKRAERAGLTWEEAEGLSDAEVEERLFEQVGRNEPWARAPIDLASVHMELRRAGVTLMLLWSEYQQAVADGGTGKRPYQYSQFCELYGEYRKKLSPSMRQTHRAGEKAFVDFSGKKPRLVDGETGEEIEVELFVMVLGASNYTYAEAVRTQGLLDFAGATVRGLEYFGCVPEMLVPDQLRSAVKTPDRREPEINATYAELGQHYATAIVPARPRKPKDKAKVEGGVLIAQRWILACLRNRRFFSLEELNAAIRELLERLNTRPFQKLEGNRRSAFEKLDRPAMKPLPARRYELGEWKLNVGVNVDYHFTYDDRHYSVPCALINARVDVRATSTVVEAWRNRTRVTSHERSYGPKGTAVTKPEHRPREHREWGAWPPERLVGWAQKKGPKTGEVAAAMLARGGHPESGRRACLGLVRMGERYGEERLEAACERALAINNPTYKTVESILKNGLDKVKRAEEVEAKPVVHENIRGGAYFDREEQEAARDADEIEARYLEDERFAIMNESTADTTGEAPCDGRWEEAKTGNNTNEIDARCWEEDGFWSAKEAGTDLGCNMDVVNNAEGPTRAAGPPPAWCSLPELIEQLRAAWEKPRTVRRGGRRVDERGGDDSRSGAEGGSSCTSQSACVELAGNEGEPGAEREESRRPCVTTGAMCETDEDRWVNVVDVPHRGEVK